MENEVSDTPSVEQSFYGMTLDGEIVQLPKAEYASAALHKARAELEAEGKELPELVVIFNEFEYAAALSAVDAELNDVDGDGMIPTYAVFPFDNLRPVFPHPSVDTDEEAAEFVEGYPLTVAGPVKLTQIRDHWPRQGNVEVAGEEAAPDAAE